jgi:hypothetical protein
LRQPALQELGQDLLFRIHPRAERTGVQVRTETSLMFGAELPALSSQDLNLRFPAIHPALYLA